MTQKQSTDDLQYLTAVARAGSRRPLLGGRIGLAWSVLLIPTLVMHGLIEMGVVKWPEMYIGIMWMIFGVVGTILSAILSRRIEESKGTFSVANAVEGISWPVTGALIFTFAFSIAFATNFGAPYELFNIIMAFAFGLYTLNHAILGKLTQQGYLRLAAWTSAVFMAICTVFMAHPEIYFVAALGVICVGIVPSVMEIQREADYAG